MSQPVIAWLQGWSFTPDIWGDVEALLPGYKHLFIEDPATYIPAQPQILVGWSLGAMYAIELAARYPNYVTDLIVLSSTLQFCPEQRQFGWPRRVVQRMIDALGPSSNQVVAQFRQQLSENSAILTLDIPSLDQLTEGLVYLRDSNLQDTWNSLDIPHLWIHGEHDPICPIEAVPQNANLVRLPIGHVPFTETGCWDAIRRWLDENT